MHSMIWLFLSILKIGERIVSCEVSSDFSTTKGIQKSDLRSRMKYAFAESSYGPSLIAVILLFTVWELIVRILHINPITLPPPTAVIAELFRSFSFFLTHAGVTLYEAVAGFILGLTIAISLGAIMAHSSFLERALLPIAVLANVTPIMAVAPLFVIWFGFGALPKILIAAIITFFPMLVNSIMGFRSIDENHYEYMKSLHASTWEIFTKLRIPNSLPYLFSAAKTCVSLSVMGAVVGEWSGATRGLGNVIQLSSNYMQIDKMFAAIFMLAVMGVTLTNIIRFIERKVLYWHVSTTKQK